MTVATINGLSPEEYRVIKNLIDPSNKFNNEQIGLFLHVCKERKLDPRLKQIYAIPRKNKDTDRNELTVQVGIDGFRLIAERTGRYAPGRPTEFVFAEDGSVISATAYVKKQTLDNTWHEVSATVFMVEYRPKFNDRFWVQMPCSQLEKCAESKAIRKAFPGETSGLYSPEEMAQGGDVIQAEVAEPEIVIDTSPQAQELRLEISAETKDFTEAQLARFNDGLKKNNIKLEEATVEQLELSLAGARKIRGGK